MAELLNLVCKVNSYKEECIEFSLRDSAQCCAGWMIRIGSEQLWSDGQCLQGFKGSTFHGKHSFHFYLDN